MSSRSRSKWKCRPRRLESSSEQERPLATRLRARLPGPRVSSADDCKLSGDQDFTPQAFHIEARGRAAHPGYRSRKTTSTPTGLHNGVTPCGTLSAFVWPLGPPHPGCAARPWASLLDPVGVVSSYHRPLSGAFLMPPALPVVTHSNPGAKPWRMVFSVEVRGSTKCNR